MKSLLTAVAVLGAALAATGLPLDASADEVEAFYKGSTLTFRVGSGVGGGYDTTARIVAPSLGRYLPGEPTVVVENFPGAGGLRLANNIANVAPKDGSVIGLFAAEVVLTPKLKPEGAKFNGDEFVWLGSFHTDINTCVVSGALVPQVKSLDDLIGYKRTIIFGSTGPQANPSKWTRFLAKKFKAPVSIVEGYKGTKDIVLAIKRGEADALCGLFESSLASAFSSELSSGELIVFLQGGITRRSEIYPHSTAIADVVAAMDDKTKSVFNVIFGPAEITRPIAGPPGMHKDRAAAIERALLLTMKDEKVVRDGEKLGISWKPMSAAEVQKRMADFLSEPQSTFQEVNDIMDGK